MLALSIAVVLAVGHPAVPGSMTGLEGSRSRPGSTRAVGVGVVIAAVAGILLAGPSERWEEFKRG